MATITSLSEVAVPLVRGAGKKSFQKGKTKSGVDAGGVRILWDTAGDYRKMWWNDVVKKDIADAIGASQQVVAYQLKKLREQSLKEGVDDVFTAALLGGIAGAAGGFALAAMMFEQFTKKE